MNVHLHKYCILDPPITAYIMLFLTLFKIKKKIPLVSLNVKNTGLNYKRQNSIKHHQPSPNLQAVSFYAVCLLNIHIIYQFVRSMSPSIENKSELYIYVIYPSPIWDIFSTRLDQHLAF